MLIYIGMGAAILLMIGAISSPVTGHQDPPTPAELQKRLVESARKRDVDPVQLRRMEEQARRWGLIPRSFSGSKI